MSKVKINNDIDSIKAAFGNHCINLKNNINTKFVVVLDQVELDILGLQYYSYGYNADKGYVFNLKTNEYIVPVNTLTEVFLITL